MDAEQVRAIARKLPHVEETVQWGGVLVFWVGDKAIGGKMFAVLRLENEGKAVMSFSAGPERYAELIEQEGIIPAPYMARIHWVALEHWGALSRREAARCVEDAHALTYAKLTKRTREALALPGAERRNWSRRGGRRLRRKSSRWRCVEVLPSQANQRTPKSPSKNNVILSAAKDPRLTF